MRIPILAFAAGVLFLQFRPVLPDAPSWGVAGLLLCLPALYRQAWPCRVLGLVAACALGFAWAGWRAEIRLADQLDAGLEGVDIPVVGVVAALPQAFERGQRFEFEVERAGAAGQVPQRIMLSLYQDSQHDLQDLHAGERWAFTVRLRRPHGNANPGGFDYEAWLLERNIRATGYVRPGAMQRLDALVWRPDYLIERQRQRVRDNFLLRLPPAGHPYAGILVALAVGDQRAISGDLWSVFNKTGVTHALSISGLHVTMIAALFGSLLSFLWRRVPVLALRFPAQKAGILAACLAAMVYALLSGFAVPAQRTLYMLAVVAAAMLSGRQVAPSRTLALALFVVLLVDPWCVLAPGFWLSFGAVAALFYVAAGEVGEGRGWRWRLRGWGSVQWAATLASVPVLLLVFQQFSLVSPLANALAVPVISFIVTPLALLGALFPWPPLLWLAHEVLVWLMAFLEWCAGWPLWQAPAPPLWAAVAAGLGVVLCLLPRGVPGRLSGLLLLLPALFWPAPRPPAGSAEVVVLDVGQGLAVVVRSREHVLIYDPGPLYSAESDAGQRVVVPFLRTLGINRVDMLMVTHRDSDHSGGTASVLAALPVAEVRSSLEDARGSRCEAGQHWSWEGVDFEVLHPPAGHYGQAGRSNHLSCVLRVAVGGHAVLLTSDIEAEDEALLRENFADRLAAEVLLVPHHGSKTSSTPAFIAAVAPRLALIPVGYRNRFGHPRSEVLARYEAAGATILRTDHDGALSLTLAPGGVGLSAWRQEDKRYWHGR